MIIDGSILIGARELKRDGSFKAVNPATGEDILQSYSKAELQDVADACALPHAAVASFSTLSLQKRVRAGNPWAVPQTVDGKREAVK